MKILCCLSIALIVFGMRSVQAASVTVKSHGETVIMGRGDGQRTEVVIRTHELQIGRPTDPRPDHIENNCTYSKFPCSIVDGIDIMVNGDSIFVPRSAFADLADLSTATITIGEHETILRLDGGDGAEGYIVKIEFDARRVKRRTVSSGTLPNQPLQTTVYNVAEEGE